ncbi:hypothetical protein F0L74_06050 [Chitinophaga agrisoli]|uniref:Chromosomal replication initiator DnaA C-terminal domain-containing protein n=1 Tax=Chitinophaga agrisoli TaxID=2607653 RepID=A0A5B2W5M7_9BACT|nr:hypothetical protein F0L74_06050 [Chitinophaga agrisoli]
MIRQRTIPKRLPQKTKQTIDHYVRWFIQEQFNLEWHDVVGPCRKTELVAARYCYAFLMRLYAGESVLKIGHNINRHYATIIHGTAQVRAWLDINDPLVTPIIEKFQKNVQYLTV